MELNEAVVDQRAEEDRRTFSWRTVFFGFTRSRRHSPRREDEPEVIFLDWHHPWLFFLAVGTMLMSSLDAFMTLQLLDRGMVEINPVMAAVLGQGTTMFAVSKMTMTGTGILALVFLAKARFLNRFRTGLFLTLFFSIYACLICYEFVYLINTM
ncbi:MAG: hypothetical protein IIA11_04475 [Proteobacteria bacterium]|nr:hypothetical protein [Pseudomonadota bacterium]